VPDDGPLKGATNMELILALILIVTFFTAFSVVFFD
jgi:hypothetical protein